MTRNPAAACRCGHGSDWHSEGGAGDEGGAMGQNSSVKPSAALDRLPVQTRDQGPSYWRERLGGTIPRIVGEAAWQGYAADGHGGQSCERLHQRGGFDLAELGYYLARAVDEGRVRIEVVS